MAKKNLPVVREPSPSSEEEEEVSEEEEQESEGDDESEVAKAALFLTSSVKNTTSDQALNPTSDDSGSGSGSESESESEPDSPPQEKPKPPSGVLKADLSVKPLSSIPVAITKTEAKDKDKDKGKGKVVAATKPPGPSPAAKSKPAAAAKRLSEDDLDVKGSHPKKAKTKVLDAVMENGEHELAVKSSDDSKKHMFQRLWSEEDEVALLKGVIEFTAKTGAIPSGDMKPFHDFIKKSFHFNASTVQLSEKLRRLKSKYKKNTDKAAQKGAEMKFSKGHQQICYDLSKKVWGNVTDDAEAEQQTKSSKNARKTEPVVVPRIEFGSGSLGSVTDLHGAAVAAGSFGEDIMRQGLAFIGGSWRPSFERKWKELQVEDMKLYLRRIGLIQEMTQLMMDSFYA